MANDMEGVDSRNVVFLPGASGDGSFWHGVGERLPAAWRKTYLNWPGLGKQAPDPAVNGVDDLVRLAAGALDRPSVLVAQSMGGIVAVRLALAYPQLVSHLVLVATSGGLDVTALGAADWRPEFRRLFPGTAPWIFAAREDLSSQFHRLRLPTLLLWGDADAISPVAVGEYLARRIAGARLEVIAGGDHAMAAELPDGVSPLIREFLAGPSGSGQDR